MFATKNTEEKQNGYSIKQTSFRLRSRRDEITAFLDGRRKIERKAKRDCHKSCAIYIQLCRSGQEMFFGAENKPKLTCAKNGEKEKMFRQRSQSSVRKWSRNGKNIFFPSCCVSDPHYQFPRTHTQRGCSQKNMNFRCEEKKGKKGAQKRKKFRDDSDEINSSSAENNGSKYFSGCCTSRDFFPQLSIRIGPNCFVF